MYDELRDALIVAGVNFEHSGPSAAHRNEQVTIEILGEQGHHSVTIYFDIDVAGNQTFVCQE